VISRDLDRLALPTLDGSVQLWELATGKAQTWKAHGQRVRNVVFSAAGDALATVGDDGILKVWDAGSRALRFESGVPGALPGHDFNVPLVWTSDGQMLAVATADHILIYSGVTGRLLRTLDPEGLVYSMRFTADDHILVSGQEDFDVAFWNPRDGTLVDSVASSHQEGIYEFCFSPDGRTLVSMVDQVKLWSLATRQEVSTLRGHERNIFTGLFSPDGNLLVTGDYGGAVWLWAARPFDEIDRDNR
jgi:WD40 repeat protein